MLLDAPALRRRRGPTRAFAVVALLLVLLLVEDRVAAGVAGRVLAQRIQSSQHLGQRPDVRIGGFPFLTQVVTGDYPDVTTTITGVTRDGLRISAVQVHLRGVHLSPGAALHTTIAGTVRVDHAVGGLVLTYADLNALLRRRGVTVGPSRTGGVAVTGTITVAGLSVTAHAVGTPTVVPGGVRMSVSHVTADGVPAAVTAVLGDGLTVTVPTTCTPYGLTVRSVAATSTGWDLTVSADALTLPGR